MKIPSLYMVVVGFLLQEIHHEIRSVAQDENLQVAWSTQSSFARLHKMALVNSPTYMFSDFIMNYLFLLYTNDMPNCLPESHKTSLFADDSNIFITSQSPYTLKNELKIAMGRIPRWLEDNKLTVNLNKTRYSIFQTKNMNIPDWLNNMKINNNTVKRVHSARFLGIILNEKLKWDDHVKQLSEYLTQIINAFKIIKNYVPEDKKRMLYYAYIYSRIQYGIEMYGTASKKLIKKGTNKTEQSNKSAPQQKLLYADHTTPQRTQISLGQRHWKNQCM